MTIRAAALALLVATPCLAQEVYMPPPPGYPPVMGDVSATLGGSPAAWQTYDFSIGAFDASAWIDAEGGIVLRVHGYTPGDPDSDRNKLRLRADYTEVPAPGLAPTAVLVEVFDRGHTGPRLSSQGQDTVLDITAITVGTGSGYGKVAGTFATTLCPRGGKNGSCRPFSGTFTTDIQFSGL